MQVRFEYEFHDEAGKWFRAHGNEVRSCQYVAVHIWHYYWINTLIKILPRTPISPSSLIKMQLAVLGLICH